MHQQHQQQPMRAVLYARAGQDRTGSSIDRQIKACREYAEAHSYDIVGGFTEVGPAAPAWVLPAGYHRAVEIALAQAASVVVVTDCSRISRHTTDLVAACDALHGLGIAIEAVDGTGTAALHRARDLLRRLASATPVKEAADNSAHRSAAAHGRRRYRRGRT
jgi:DNA invertase Pin-like site-specific DNA recombinase